MADEPKSPGPSKVGEGKAKDHEKGKGKDGDSQLPYWWGSFPSSGVAQPPPSKAQPLPTPDLKPRTSYPYPAVVDLVDQEQHARELKHRNEHADQAEKGREEATKALEAFNRQRASEIEAEKSASANEAKAAHMARVAEAESAQAAKEADIERHHNEVERTNPHLDYFANREAIERQQSASDRMPTPDREQGGGWDQER